MPTFNMFMRSTIGLADQNRVDVVIKHGLDDFATFNKFEDDDVQTQEKITTID